MGLTLGPVNQVTSQERIGSSYALGLVAVEPGTGKTKAAAVNRRYSLNQTNSGTVVGYYWPNKAIGSYPNTVAPLLRRPAAEPAPFRSP
jgi:hypothetical protein